jgi:hypothetical protein
MAMTEHARNQLYNVRIKEICENPEMARPYAGKIKGNMFKPCKKCGGKGVLQFTMPVVNVLCECVKRNILQELRDMDQAQSVEYVGIGQGQGH